MCLVLTLDSRITDKVYSRSSGAKTSTLDCLICRCLYVCCPITGLPFTQGTGPNCPVMLFKRKLCLFALFGGILFVMIATHTIQKNNILSMTLMETHATSMTVQGPAVNRTWALPSAAVPSPDRICGCPSCIADMEVSEWFAQHYEPQQQPFLTDGDNNMDPLALQWWLALQRSTDERTIYEVIQKMFQVIAPPAMDVQPKQAQCRKCAVVGNSGNLLGSQYGSLIDSHNSVIRMNKATTAGFEADVGNRTTHHFMYPESAVDIAPGVHLVLLPFKLRDLQWVASALSTGEIKTTYMRVKGRVQADKDKVIVVNPAFFKYTHDRWTERHGRYPSTGMLAVIFALHICDEVSVFGYGADQQGNWHHYWEDNKYAGAFRKTGVHNADFETEVIQKLDTEGKIKLHKR
ncbi:CMP-N-acetylneuraminate-beta-galactosamide-alpha-2,3-sialyltransferase 2 [Coregonus clupeaformis]|uniref:CMP-N-acetylneuraminate-beta-galactosamide- alpha-2,3-sialyltransferase 2 n=1 Tax=Coregonus clupeaformis TaxID=59861 RepID=UPI001E1C79F0|nr:CMP-N-acetylneuraminate-beta-galactosamide-alpha-2,3-sialyltransferase 2 [Coregonus clupeaformis]